MNGVSLPGIGGYPLHPLYSSPLFATLLAQQQQQQQHHQHHQHQQNPNALFPLHPPMPREHSHSVDHDGRSPRPMSTDWSLHQQQQHHGYNRPIKRESSLDRSDNRGASRQSGGDNGADSVGGGGIPRSSRSPSPSSHSRGDYAAGMTTNPGSGTGPASSSQKSGATWLDFLNAISSQPAASNGDPSVVCHWAPRDRHRFAWYQFLPSFWESLESWCYECR
ncbi:hypothetical protein BS47DRAFT_1120280 [Hydnum rufescens UP504]|uniref:Uncharacterized protein n=1 Tax=Hydnum rufescens UP504 TaxID=1448309 RepID=A0A9P6DUR6_9AGAM|nr:hypothetical protein BS47DRAFT_1120280 [Hydnum rufescens UP504]